jgi:hypothetical protein
MALNFSSSRSGRAYWAVAVFLVGFAVLLALLLSYFLAPAMDAAQHATKPEKDSLVAWSRLVLSIVLFVLFAGLLLTFRVGRWFVPKKSEPRSQTKYVDAWKEAGRRMQPPDDDEDE